MSTQRSSLQSVWQRFLTGLTQSDEPWIEQRRDRAGRTWWTAYDLKTRRSTQFSSEAEARIWMDQYHS